jgi:hypothetical protein
MKKWISVVGVSALLLLAGITPAAAGPVTIRLDDGLGNVVEIADGAAGDLDGTVGAVTYVGAVGAFTFNVVAGASTPIIGNSELAEIDLLSLNVTSGSGGTLNVWISDDDFTFAGVPLGTTLTAVGTTGGTLSAPTGSTVNFQSWVNGGNLNPLDGNPATGAIVPAGSVPVYIPAATAGPGAYSFTDSASFAYAGPFSLFTRAIVTLTGAGNVSFDSNLQTSVPEPASLVLMGTGLLGLARAARRRRVRATA